MNIKLIPRLISQLQKNLLPPFLIVENYLCEQWQEQFIDCYIKETGASKIGASLDIFELKKNADSETIKVEQLGPLFEYCSYSPHQWPHRFIFVHEAQALGEICSNKLLKILEEPPKNYFIIFIAKPDVFFLPTIESRAIRLKNEQILKRKTLDVSLPIEQSELTDFVKSHSYESISEAVAVWASQTKDGKKIKEALHLLQKWQESKVYHHPKLSIAAEILKLISISP